MRSLRFDPEKNALHDTGCNGGGTIPLHSMTGSARAELLEELRRLLHGTASLWLEPVELPEGWSAQVDASTLRPYFIDCEGRTHLTLPAGEEDSKSRAASAAGGGAQASLRALAVDEGLETSVVFQGQTLTHTDTAALLIDAAGEGYEAGWLCDGCQTQHGSDPTDRLYHGIVDPRAAQRGLNAFDLCCGCAHNVPAAERRYEAAAQAQAEAERRAFRDEWQRSSEKRGRDRRGPRGGGGSHGGGMAMAMVSSPTMASSPASRQAKAQPAAKPVLFVVREVVGFAVVFLLLFECRRHLDEPSFRCCP